MTREDKEQECKKCGRVFGSVKCFDVDCPNNIPKITMNQEEKDLLVKDLCTRLPYEVKVQYEDGIFIIDHISAMYEEVKLNTPNNYTIDVLEVKPYLFPIESMSEEQKKKYNFWKHEIPVCHYEYGDVVEEIELYDSPESVEYLIENHFDYHGLIPMGLAIDATGLNIY